MRKLKIYNGDLVSIMYEKSEKLLLRIGKDCEWKNGKLSWDLVRIMNEKLKNCYC